MKIILTNCTTLMALKKQISSYCPCLIEFYNLPQKKQKDLTQQRKNRFLWAGDGINSSLKKALLSSWNE
jgi:hypothetical protein